MRHTITLALVAFGCSSCATYQEPAPCSTADYQLEAAKCGDDLDECKRLAQERRRMCDEIILEDAQ